MIVLGIVLILVGALIFHYLGSEPVVRLAAAVLVVLGIVCVVVSLLSVSGDGHARLGSYGKARSAVLTARLASIQS